MKNFEIKNNESGRSMIEMLGVLAIIGVLSVGGIAGYSKAMMKYRINKTIEQITLISGNIRSFFATQGSYLGVRCSCNNSGCKNISTVGCPIIKKAKILPDEMITLTDGKITDITNAFGGSIELYDDENYKSFRFNFENIPEEACIDLISQEWSNIKITYISINYSKNC